LPTPSAYYEKTGPRAEHHQRGDDLRRALVAGRIEHPGHVVVQETAGTGGPAGPLARPVLEEGERARQARRDDQHQPPGRGDLEPDQPRPSPGDKAAEHPEGQKREVRGHGGMLDGGKEHRFTVRRGATGAGTVAPRRAVTGY
jgi:hypothetical protein